MISLPGMRWDFTGSPDMPGYEVMRSPMGSQGVALPWDSLDPSWPWGSLEVISGKGSVVG